MTSIEVFQLLVGSGLLIAIFRVIFSMGKISQKIETISSDISQIKSDIRSMESRLAHLEGAFLERGYWESRKTGTEEKTK